MILLLHRFAIHIVLFRLSHQLSYFFSVRSVALWLYVRALTSLFPEFFWWIRIFIVTLQPTKPAVYGRAGQDIDGKHVQAERNEARFRLLRRSRVYGKRPKQPFVGPVSERRLRTLSFCVVKLRNFDSVHRDNATGRLRGCIIFIYNITRRGLTALLILELGQCEGLTTGMGEKLESPMPFLFPFVC